MLVLVTNLSMFYCPIFQPSLQLNQKALLIAQPSPLFVSEDLKTVDYLVENETGKNQWTRFANHSGSRGFRAYSCYSTLSEFDLIPKRTRLNTMTNFWTLLLLLFEEVFEIGVFHCFHSASNICLQVLSKRLVGFKQVFGNLRKTHLCYKIVLICCWYPTMQWVSFNLKCSIIVQNRQYAKYAKSK